MSQISTEVKDRIVLVANELYEESERSVFPTVDAVRRAAKADMNTTSTVMRDWRRQQTTQAAPVAVTVPESVSEANAAALAALWQQAQALANESLGSAQAAWDVERKELDEMRLELATAYEDQAAEFEQMQIKAKNDVDAYEAQLEDARVEISDLRESLSDAILIAERTEAANQELTRSADDLRAELKRAHLDIDLARKTLADEQASSAALDVRYEELSKELHKQQTKTAQAHDEIKRLVLEGESIKSDKERVSLELESVRKTATHAATQAKEEVKKLALELESAREEIARAREESAQLTGRVEGYKEQANLVDSVLKKLSSIEQADIKTSSSKS